MAVVDDLEEWFRREILPYEAALMRYLAGKRMLEVDVEDLRNDVYVRVLESAEKVRPTLAKAFLFSTARNLLIDLARRNRVVAIELLEDLDALNVLIDEVSPETRLAGRQQLQRLSKLFNRLPERCREVLWLRRVEGLPQRAVAERLKLTEIMVAKHVHRGIRYLADSFYGREREKTAAADRRGVESEPRHET